MAERDPIVNADSTAVTDDSATPENQKKTRKPGRPKKEVDPNAPAPEPKPKKPAAGVLHSTVAKIYEGGNEARGILLGLKANPPPSMGKLKTWWIDEGSKQLAEIKPNGECKLREAAWLYDEILNWTATALYDNDHYQFTSAEGLLCANKVITLLPVIERPKDVLFQNEEGICFNRIDQPLEETGHPLFNELLGRMSNSGAFCNWVSYLFIPDSNRDQAAYLYGEGGDGKGSAAWVLGEAFRAATVSDAIPPWDLRSDFGLESYINARFIAYPDFVGKIKLKNPIFMTLTGNARMDVPRKHMRVLQVKMRCMLMFCSNTMLEVDDTPAMQRRFLLFKLRKAPDDRGDGYRDDLFLELGSFVAYCHRITREKNPDYRKPILNDAETAAYMEEIGAGADYAQNHWFDGEFEKDASGRVPLRDVLNSLELKYRSLASPEAKDARKWLVKRFGDCVPIKVGGITSKGYKGFRRKDFINRAETTRF